MGVSRRKYLHGKGLCVLSDYLTLKFSVVILSRKGRLGLLYRNPKGRGAGVKQGRYYRRNIRTHFFTSEWQPSTEDSYWLAPHPKQRHPLPDTQTSDINAINAMRVTTLTHQHPYPGQGQAESIPAPDICYAAQTRRARCRTHPYSHGTHKKMKSLWSMSS